jgi:hypothetical protein
VEVRSVTLPYTTPPTATAGQPLSASDWNTKVRDSLEALAKPARCRVYRSAALSLANATTIAIAWDAEEWDTDAFHDLATNTTRLTAPRAGIYLVRASVYYGVAAGGVYRLAAISKNGTTEYYNTNRNGTQVSVEVIGEVSMVAGDYIEILSYQDSGGALSLVVGKGHTDASIRWVCL